MRSTSHFWLCALRRRWRLSPEYASMRRALTAHHSTRNSLRSPELGRIALLGVERHDGLPHEIDCLLLAILRLVVGPVRRVGCRGCSRRGLLRRSASPPRRRWTLSDQIVVEDELVAVAHQQ